MMSVSNPTAHWGSRSSRLFSFIVVCFVFLLTTVVGFPRSAWAATFTAGGPDSVGWYWNAGQNNGAWQAAYQEGQTGSETSQTVRFWGQTGPTGSTEQDMIQYSCNGSSTPASRFGWSGGHSGAGFSFSAGTACTVGVPITIEMGYCTNSPSSGSCDSSGTFVSMAKLIVRWNAPLAPPITQCTSSQLTDSAVSLNGTILTVRTKIAVSSFSKVGVIVPDGGDSTATPTFNLTNGNSVDGSPGYLYGTFTQNTPVTTARLVLYNVSNNPVCYTSLTVGAGTINANGSSVGATNPDDSSGADCGLNPFCYIKAALKWAFVPGASTFNQWQTLKDNASTKPPFSIIAGCISYVQGYMNIQEGGDTVQLDGGGPHIPIGGGNYGGSDIQFAPMVWARDYAATSAWYNDAKTIASIFLYVCFAWWAFGYIQQNFGSKGETQ